MVERRHTHTITLPGEQPIHYKPEESAYLESDIGVTGGTQNMSRVNRDKPFLPPGYLHPQHLVTVHGSHSLPKYLHDGHLPNLHHEGPLHQVAHLHPGHHYTTNTTPRKAARSRQERSVEVGQLVPPVTSMASMPTITWPENYQGRQAGTMQSVRQQSSRLKKPVEEEQKMSECSRCCFGLLTILAQILLHGVLALTVYWVIQYRWDGEGLPFAWRGEEKGDLEKQWNLHPVLMVTGFIYCMGQAMLVYRSCRCCRQIWSKLLHTMFHMLGIPCVVLGFIAVWDYHSLKKDNEGNSTPIPHFYSIHSWLGLVTMGLALLQFLVGVFSFLLLLCCQSATARFRAGLVPIHSTVGTTTFILAVATAIAGITETAFFKLSSEGYDATGQPVITKLVGKYINMSEESIFLNTIGVILIALAIILPAILGCDGFRAGLAREGGSNK